MRNKYNILIFSCLRDFVYHNFNAFALILGQDNLLFKQKRLRIHQFVAIFFKEEFVFAECRL